MDCRLLYVVAVPLTLIARVEPTHDLASCDTSPGHFAMPTHEICGDGDCNPSGGVPNRNLGAQPDKHALDAGPVCDSCTLPLLGCLADPTVTPGLDATFADQFTADAGCPTGYKYRRCVTMPAGTAYITCLAHD